MTPQPAQSPALPLVGITSTAPLLPAWKLRIGQFLDVVQRPATLRRVVTPDIPPLVAFVQEHVLSAVVYTPMDTRPTRIQQRGLDLLDDVVLSGSGAAVLAFVAEACPPDIRRDGEPRRCFGRNPRDPWGLTCAATTMRFANEVPLPVFVVPLVTWITMPPWTGGQWTKVAERGVWSLAWRFTPDAGTAPAPRPTQAGLWNADDDQQLVRSPSTPRMVDAEQRHRRS